MHVYRICNVPNINSSVLVTRNYVYSLGPAPERPISVNPRLKFCFVFVSYIPLHCIG